MKRILLPLLMLALVGCKHKPTKEELIKEEIQVMVSERKLQFKRDSLELLDDLDAIRATEPYSHERSEAIYFFEGKYYYYLNGDHLLGRDESALKTAMYKILAAMLMEVSNYIRREGEIIVDKYESE